MLSKWGSFGKKKKSHAKIVNTSKSQTKQTVKRIKSQGFENKMETYRTTPFTLDGVEHPNTKVITEIVKGNIDMFNHIKVKHFSMPTSNTRKLKVKTN